MLPFVGFGLLSFDCFLIINWRCSAFFRKTAVEFQLKTLNLVLKIAL